MYNSRKSFDDNFYLAKKLYDDVWLKIIDDEFHKYDILILTNSSSHFFKSKTLHQYLLNKKLLKHVIKNYYKYFK